MLERYAVKVARTVLRRGSGSNATPLSDHLSFFHIGRRNRRARRETVQGAAGQDGDDVRVADGEGEVGVNIREEVV